MIPDHTPKLDGNATASKDRSVDDTIFDEEETDHETKDALTLCDKLLGALKDFMLERVASFSSAGMTKVLKVFALQTTSCDTLVDAVEKEILIREEQLQSDSNLDKVAKYASLQLSRLQSVIVKDEGTSKLTLGNFKLGFHSLFEDEGGERAIDDGRVAKEELLELLSSISAAVEKLNGALKVPIPSANESTPAKLLELNRCKQHIEHHRLKHLREGDCRNHLDHRVRLSQTKRVLSRLMPR